MHKEKKLINFIFHTKFIFDVLTFNFIKNIIFAKKEN